MESLCRALNQLSESLLQKQGGGDPSLYSIPTSIDSQLGSTRQALQAELYGRLGGVKPSSGGRKKKEKPTDATILKTAWRALTALRCQLETCQKMAEECKAVVKTV